MPSSHTQSGPSLIDVLNRTEEPLSLDETLSAAALRLRHVVSFDALAVFVVHADVLVARFALGENLRHLSSLRIRNGQGLAGWVAETGNYIINGNPKVEPGLEGSRSFALCSALAVPLLNAGRTVGVLSVYSLQPDAFTSEHLNVLQASAHQLGDMVGEKLAVEQQRNSRSSDWRHRGSHARRNSVEETQSGLPSVLTSAK
jgi:GAF domain-containing protein